MEKRVEKAFLYLISLGIETSTVDNIFSKELFSLSQKDWADIRIMADKQGVSAIVFDGLNHIINKFGADSFIACVEKAWWQNFVFEWMGVMLQTEHRNKYQCEVMENMASLWSSHGCRVMVMKGQASATFYPIPIHRSPGDIDCYLFDNYNLGNSIAKGVGAKVDESWYKHSVINFRGETFENHQFFVHTRDGKRGKKLELDLEKALNRPDMEFNTLTTSIIIPPVQWTAMFLAYHSCGHFISEGLRLKQLLDWALLLKNKQDDIDWKTLYSFCEEHHLKRFIDAATDICINHLGIIITNKEICADSTYSERILNSTLYDDDYIFGSGKSNWYNRFHLIRNMFHYRWKFEEIYEESIWRQLWYDASGFLFHTE